MDVERIFDGVYRVDGRICTLNLAPHRKVYGEDLLNADGKEYRAWNPYRSKLAAAIVLGLRNLKIGHGSNVLYLGAATGTTSSHVSDIVGKDGIVYCVEISERNMRELFKICEARPNMMPIFGDARNIESYTEDVGTVDSIYQDVSARDQDEILLLNSRLLKPQGYAYVAIKSQSIDVSKNPKEVYEEFIRKVSDKFELVERIDINRFDKKHLFVVLKKIE
jgi:fibrillarin-like pre-rRNA processing protein